MRVNLRELVQAALQLPPEARGARANRLLDSLHGEETDSDAEAAWEAGVARRVSELDSGAVKSVQWSEARQQILRAK